MNPCPAIELNSSGAESMVGAVDCFVKSTVQDGYAALLGSGSFFNQALTILLTLYVAIIGYRLIFGHTSMSVREIAPRMLLIGGVLALATSWPAYQALIFDVLTDGPQEIASSIAGSDSGAPSLMARVDTLTTEMIKIADDWAAANQRTASPTAAPSAATPPAAPAPTPTAIAAPTSTLPFPLPVAKASFGPNLLLLGAMLLLLASAGVLVVSKALLGLMLALGPIFVVLALFDFTRGLAMGWLRVGILLAIVPLLVLMTTFGALTILEPLVVDLAVQARNDVFELKSAATLFVAILVVAAIGLQLFRLATVLTAGWRLPGAPRDLSAGMPQSSQGSSQAPVLARNAASERLDILVSSIERSATLSETPDPASSLARARMSYVLPQDQTEIQRREATSSRTDLGAAPVKQHRGPLRPVRGMA